MKTKCCLLVLVVFALLTGSAKTVALWPLDYDALNPDNGGRCAVSAANDLVAGYNNGGGMVTDGYGVGWNLPPNPDATASLRFTPVNRGYVRMSNSGGTYQAWSNPTAGLLLAPEKDWTFELFARLDASPGTMRTVAAVFWNTEMQDADRWMLMLKSNSKTKGVNFEFYCGNPDIRTNNTDYVFAELSAEEYAALMTGFHHVALTHKVDTTAGETTWQFYYDGVLRNTRTVSDLPDTHDRTQKNNALDLGGRGAAVGYAFPGALDYCRISDEVLEPTAFLNAGGTGTVIPTVADPTYVRWPLGRTPSGAIDGAPSVGSAYLGSSRLAASSGTSARSFSVVADGDQAFDGQIPNTATTIKAADNAGSLLFARGEYGSSVAIPNLGLQLTLTNDFTVEGWYKFENRHQSPGNTWLRICGALGTTGWALQLYYNTAISSMPYLNLHVQANDTYIHGTTPPNFGTIPFGEEDVWRHLALVYDADGGEGGRGFWRFYINGELSGTCTLTNNVAAGLTYPSTFYLNNISTTSGRCAGGKFDHWRVCRTALAPEQFLCATTGARDATDVLAYWPLDAQRGVYLDGTDLTGNYTFEPPMPTTYQAQAVTDAPPQADRATDLGAVGFAGAGSNSSYLSDCTEATRSVFNGDAWTFETWMKRTDANTTWQIIFGLPTGYVTYTASNSKWNTWPGSVVFFTYRPGSDKGFVMYSQLVDDDLTDGKASINDKSFIGDDAKTILVPTNVWTHVALTFTHDDNTGTFILYTNGVRAATMSGKYVSIPPNYGFFLGGRATSANSFHGYLADVRLSKRVLVPGEFLCDITPNVPETCGFWPLDYANNTLDLATRKDDAFSDMGGVGVTGLTRGARGKVPNPDTSDDFQGNRKANVGAVEVAAGGNLGTSLFTQPYVEGPFTVEGWFKWAQAAGNVQETLVGNWNVATNGGWRLLLDSSVTPARFRLQAQYGNSFTHVANGAFAADAASLKGDWHHLALTHDPTIATGVWSLYVDAHAAGAVTNFFRASSGVLGTEIIRLGAASGEQNAVSFVGGLDMWRLSSGVRTPEAFLYRPAPGLVVNVR